MSVAALALLADEFGSVGGMALVVVGEVHRLNLKGEGMPLPAMDELTRRYADVLAGA